MQFEYIVISTFSAHADSKSEPTPAKEEEPPKVESDPESDIELDLLDTVIEGDKDADSQEMGDDDKEPTEEDMDQAGDLRAKAAKSFSNGEFEGKQSQHKCLRRCKM